MYTTKQKTVAFLAWLLIFPTAHYVAFQITPHQEPDWPILLVMLGLLFITMLNPLQLQNVSVSMERWLTFAIFFQYGIFTEMIFMQLAMIFVLLTSKSSMPILYRFCVNSTVFCITSLVAGMVFYSTGGITGNLDFYHILFFGILYASSYSFVNNLLLKIYFYLLAKPFSLLTKDSIWDYVATICVLPFAIAIYYLQANLGILSVLLIGIPFVIVLSIFRMYDRSDQLNDQLKVANEIGHELADSRSFQEVLERFVTRLKDAVAFDEAYIVDLRGKVLLPLIGYEAGTITTSVTGLTVLADKEQRDSLNDRQSQVYNRARDLKDLTLFTFPTGTQSVLTTPIVRNKTTEGFLILTSKKKYEFDSSVVVTLIDILATYLAVSLERARYIDQTVAKGLRCGLTNLYNFRYLEEQLEREISRFYSKKIKALSVIILDIDRFKGINDTYGHQSGNDLLISLARILEYEKGDGQTVARYGGEEFVILLPDMDKEEATHVAENLRKRVEQTVFRIVPDLSAERRPMDVEMTISLGVASIPEDADSAKTLLRNADRALYIGGKQAGRNRVGIYNEWEPVSVNSTVES